MGGVMRTGRWATATLIVAALLAGCDGSGDVSDAKPSPSATSGVTDSASSSSSPTDPGPLVECPKDIVLDPDPALPDAVPEGATSVRLCAADPGAVSPPLDALTTNVTAVVQSVNDQKVATRGCADHQLPAYQLAFGYPDGTSFVVSGRFTLCAELLVGSARRAHAHPPLDRFIEVLRQQRETASPPSKPADLDRIGCAQPPATWTTDPQLQDSPRLARPVDLTVAALCFGDLDDTRHARRTDISPHDLAILLKSMRTDTVRVGGDVLGCHVPLQPEYWIVGANVWHDPITMQYGCFGLPLGGGRDWVPRGGAKKIVHRLIHQAR